MARRKPKRPRAPKQSAGLQTWQNYDNRLGDWNKKCNQIDSDKKKKSDLIEKIKRKRF